MLHEVALFDGLTPEEMGRVQSAGRDVDVATGEVIIQRGSKGQALYIIRDGRVRVTCPLENEAITLAILNAPQHFGEMSLIDGAAHSANIGAMRPTRLFVIEGDAFERLTGDPVLAAKLWHNMAFNMSIRIRETNKIVWEYSKVSKNLAKDENFRKIYRLFAK